MLPRTHILFGLIASLILYLIFPQISTLEASIIFLSSFLIDADHYIYYLFVKKDFSLKRAYNFFLYKKNTHIKLSLREKEKKKQTILLFHGLETLIILFLLISVHRVFIFILVGVLIHLILDLIDLLHNLLPIGSHASWVYTFIRNKKREKFR
jgi:hypothetical protein